jgi:hypothetical protein
MYRCADGSCRAQCLQFDGCPLVYPYHCANRECAVNADACKAAEQFDPRIALKRRLLADQTGFLQPGYNTTWKAPCYSGCYGQLKSSLLQFQVDLSKTTDIILAVDSASAVRLKLVVPSGAALETGLTAVGAKLKIRPVGDSRIRETVNRVTLTRRSEFGVYLTYPATVLSAAFECVGTDNFRSPIEVVASVDLNKQPEYRDVCLAYLYTVAVPQFQAWKCVERTDGARLALPVRSVLTNSTEPLHIVKGNIYGCNQNGRIFAFVHAPSRAPQPREASKDNFWADNLIWLTLGFCAAAALIAGVFYVGKRLHRFRKKYKGTSKEVDKMQEEVDEMEQFGGSAGNKDEAIEMMSNPLVVQMKDMQARLDKKNKEVIQEEERQRQKANEMRQEAISALQTDRDKLSQELEKLKAELAEAESSRRTVAVPQPMISTGNTSAAANNPSLGRETSMSVSGHTAPVNVKTTFDSKAPTRPKKKNID